MFSEMRETRTGFGAKMKNDYSPGQLEAKGGLQPDDDDEEDVDGDEEEDDEEGDGIEIDEEEEEEDHNF